MKKVNATIESKVTNSMATFMDALAETMSGEKAVHLRLARAISSANHMLNVALAMAASAGMSKEVVDKALDLGEVTANTLVEQAIAASRNGGVG